MYITNEIRDNASVGDSTGGMPEEGLSVRPIRGDRRMGRFVNVLIIAGVEERVSEHEQCTMLSSL